MTEKEFYESEEYKQTLEYKLIELNKAWKDLFNVIIDEYKSIFNKIKCYFGNHEYSKRKKDGKFYKYFCKYCGKKFEKPSVHMIDKGLIIVDSKEILMSKSAQMNMKLCNKELLCRIAEVNKRHKERNYIIQQVGKMLARKLDEEAEEKSKGFCNEGND